VIVAHLVYVGGNSNVIWEFGGAVLAVFLVAAMVLSAVTAIRRFLGD
jgi:hypothetical protein